MTNGLLLDTHVILWLDSGNVQLKPVTRALIDDCWQADGTIFVSAVSVWEIAILVDRGHIRLDLPVEAWVERFAGRSGVKIVPLDHLMAIRAYQLHPIEHRDPGDRLLIASAILLGCPLVTYDDRIRRFGRLWGPQHGLVLAD